MFTASTCKFLDDLNIPVRLACSNSEGWPIVLSLWYVRLDGSLYLATQEDAQVVGFLRANPDCGYEVAADMPPYCGVRGRARAEILPQRGPEILRLLLQRYLGGEDNTLGRNLLARAETEVAIRLTPLSASTWDFTSRMQEFVAYGQTKPCP